MKSDLYEQPADIPALSTQPSVNAKQRVDSRVRRQLSQDVRRLITGRITNDQFDDVYYDIYEHSEDLAIREISRFCFGLYSSDLPLPYRLRRQHAVDEMTRKQAARAVLFLRSDLKYPYPETPDGGANVLGCSWYMGGLVGLALLVIALFAFIGRDVDVAIGCLIAGAGTLAICAFVRWLEERRYVAFHKQCEGAGDISVWPFANVKSLQSVSNRS